MASAFKISDLADEAGRNAYANAVTALLDAGGYFEIRTGAPPTNTTDADSGTLLATLFCSTPAFSPAAGGISTIVPMANELAVAAGTAGHYRAKTAAGVVIMQGTAGLTADTPDLVLDDKTLIVDDVVTITAFSYDVPA